MCSDLLFPARFPSPPSTLHPLSAAPPRPPAPAQHGRKWQWPTLVAAPPSPVRLTFSSRVCPPASSIGSLSFTSHGRSPAGPVVSIGPANCVAHTPFRPHPHIGLPGNRSPAPFLLRQLMPAGIGCNARLAFLLRFLQLPRRSRPHRLPGPPRAQHVCRLPARLPPFPPFSSPIPSYWAVSDQRLHSHAPFGFYFSCNSLFYKEE